MAVNTHYVMRSFAVSMTITRKEELNNRYGNLDSPNKAAMSEGKSRANQTLQSLGSWLGADPDMLFNSLLDQRRPFDDFLEWIHGKKSRDCVAGAQECTHLRFRKTQAPPMSTQANTTILHVLCSSSSSAAFIREQYLCRHRRHAHRE